MSTVMLRHNKIDLALHVLRAEPLDAARPSRPLLLLHGLGDSSPTAVPHWAAAWPGPISALDFTGHGGSTVPRSGGYSPEMLMADADHALAHLTARDTQGETTGTGKDDETNRDTDSEADGQASGGTNDEATGVTAASITVLGRGLGAYVALQLAGARATRVHGAILLDGPGLAGGPTGPSSQNYFALPSDGSTPDPYALVELGRDLRPGDYAQSFVRLAVTGSGLSSPIAVCAQFRPKWLAAVADTPGVIDTSIADALTTYA